MYSIVWTKSKVRRLSLFFSLSQFPPISLAAVIVEGRKIVSKQASKRENEEAHRGKSPAGTPKLLALSLSLSLWQCSAFVVLLLLLLLRQDLPSFLELTSLLGSSFHWQSKR